MSLADWFVFVPKKEREKREKEFDAAMFPLGDAQKDREREMACRCIQTNISDEEKLYHLLVVQSAFRMMDEEEKTCALKKWYGGALSRKLTPVEKSCLVAFADLCRNLSSVTDYPDRQQIEERAAQLRETYMKDWKEKKGFSFV